MSETAEKFMVWFLDKHLKYGDFFDDWWKSEGSDIFFEYAKKMGMEFLKDTQLSRGGFEKD